MPRQPKNPSYRHALSVVLAQLYDDAGYDVTAPMPLVGDDDVDDVWTFETFDGNVPTIVIVNEEVTVDDEEIWPAVLIAKLSEMQAEILGFRPEPASAA